jgi:hypothetical protein
VNDLFERRYERSYLEFARETTDAECPPILAITDLSMPGVVRERLIKPASSVFIVMTLPQLN